MLNKSKKEFIKNKLINSIKIKKLFKILVLRSIVNNYCLKNSERAFYLIKYKLNYTYKTGLNDICLSTGIYKKATRYNNLSRYEFHKLCRTNKLTSWITQSW